MNFAFAIFKYFPFGGLQRDMLRMAEAAVRRGHRVTVFASSWDGDPPPDGGGALPHGGDCPELRCDGHA